MCELQINECVGGMFLTVMMQFKPLTPRVKPCVIQSFLNNVKKLHIGENKCMAQAL